eukprot:m.87417 g.87417  ORF g.87417 m.87417 type:complete len:277 (-) comp14776_c0_seq7:332-1162(-)
MISLVLLAKGIDVVFHVASYGMSGSAQLQKPLVRSINVHGTQNVVDLCLELSVTSLVYISTYNVVFAGQVTIQLEFACPSHLYLHANNGQRPLSMAVLFCLTSRTMAMLISIAGELGSQVPSLLVDARIVSTKCEAEQLALSAHTARCANDQSIHVTAIRPAAIYGEHETRHLPRIIKVLNSGLDFFAIGSQDVLCDWVHGQNLVHGILLAGQACLMQDADKCGRAYPISDGCPVNNFVFLSQVCLCCVCYSTTFLRQLVSCYGCNTCFGYVCLRT